MVFLEYGDDLKASVLSWTNDRPSTYEPTSSLERETDDMVWWDFADTGSMGGALAAF